MARPSEQFTCQSCGDTYRKWQGRCDSCGEWNSLLESTGDVAVPSGLTSGKGRSVAFTALNADISEYKRTTSQIGELDRVLGGGFVPGSSILIGGDPGIGKSTLLLQAVAKMALAGSSCIYISGEEATQQISMRAQRLGLADAPVQLASANSIRDIITSVEKTETPKLLVIDSIQTVFADNLPSAPGSVAQVRASAQELIRLARKTGLSVILVGHVTKDGQIAGPRVLEHMVDTVLYFEGDRGHQFRILRAVKNRFGATDEIGVFEMSDRGLQQVENPSSLFISSPDKTISGASVFAGMEGSRPLLVEIQGLVAPTPQATPRRAVVGWDASRLAMLLAVLDTRCELSFSGSEVYLNVAGGLRVQEPAADLAVAAALISSASDIPVPPGSLFFGEIGLSGEVRPVGQTDARLKEAAKLGFTTAIIPAGSKVKGGTVKIIEVEHLREIVSLFTETKAVSRAV
ncbi:DNA repair protein RadA [uncultured Sneathiella sp.]|jgi:DNA repair protein RadA/Sms|uniref:DNA repair protein RadA n=1 Tax=uncultured Sneathiella sp. TaxID=879315 RepID=UPI0030DD0A73|tara:strand:+ start:346 stop:1725 length:1380 start_codon:yes stop_codon:yes gene_type:complete